MDTTENRLKVLVCRGPSCSLMGGSELGDWCRELAESGLPVDFANSGCTGNCLESPVVEWNGRYLTECTPEKLTRQLIEDGCF